MPSVESTLEREIQRIVRRELAQALAPLASSLVKLAPRAEATAGGEPSAPATRRTRRGRRGRPRKSEAAAPSGASSAASTGSWTAGSIKGLRKKLGLTQKDFAARAGVTPVAVYLWESGRTSPKGKSVVALDRAAGGSSDGAAAAEPKARRGRPPGRGRKRRGRPRKK